MNQEKQAKNPQKQTKRKHPIFVSNLVNFKWQKIIFSHTSKGLNRVVFLRDCTVIYQFQDWLVLLCFLVFARNRHYMFYYLTFPTQLTSSWISMIWPTERYLRSKVNKVKLCGAVRGGKKLKLISGNIRNGLWNTKIKLNTKPESQRSRQFLHSISLWEESVGIPQLKLAIFTHSVWQKFSVVDWGHLFPTALSRWPHWFSIGFCSVLCFVLLK